MRRSLTMNLLLVVVAGLLALLALGNNRPGQAQTPVATTPAELHGIGRYQITGVGSNNYVVLVDTHTGHCWSKSPYQTGSNTWADLGSPVPSK